MIQTSTSTYYYKPKIDRAKRDKADADLRDLMEQVQVTFPRCGYRTMKEYLARNFNLIINHKKIRRAEFEDLIKDKENVINQNNGQSGCSKNQPQTVQL